MVQVALARCVVAHGSAQALPGSVAQQPSKCDRGDVSEGSVYRLAYVAANCPFGESQIYALGLVEFTLTNSRGHLVNLKQYREDYHGPCTKDDTVTCEFNPQLPHHTLKNSQ